jgi:hypothetical protein
MSGRHHEAELSQLEADLRALGPRAGLDRDVLLFRAGRASARSGWRWPAATALSTTAAAVLAVVLALGRPAETTPRVVYVPLATPVAPQPPPAEVPSTVPPAAASAAPSDADDGPAWLSSEAARLREHVLHWGFDGLPQAPAMATPAPTPADVLRSR